MIPSIIIAPLDAPQIATPQPPPPPAPPKVDWLEQRILDLVRESEPVKYWQILNVIGEELSARSRTEGREARMKLLPRMQRLIDLEMIFRGWKNSVATFKPAPKPVGIPRRRRKRTVGKAVFTKPVSEVKPSNLPGHGSRGYQVYAEVHPASSGNQETPPKGPETECALAPELVSEAARRLGRLPKNQPRKPTGWLHGQHCWRGRLLVLPDGEVAPLYWCCRGRVLLAGFRDDPLVDENTEFIKHLLWAVRRERDVRLYKCPEAVLLGRLKRGVRERPSALKAISARRNGVKPARRGPRGRPKAVRFP